MKTKKLYFENEDANICYPLQYHLERAKELVKWQQKQMYSEEEARKIWYAGQEYWKTSGESITFEELIEHFKKNKKI